MNTATHRWAALLLLAIASPAALAQTPTLGDEFIFFVDGTNILVPIYQGEVVNDPADPTSGNKVSKFGAGVYTHNGFAWEQSTGVDASDFVGESYGESDTLYLRLRSSERNATLGNVNLWLTDKTDGSAAARDSILAGVATADHEMRLQWAIPAELHDGAWHDLAIPLPPATYDSLEAARTRGELDDLAENWQYTGAWTAGGYGIGIVGGFDPGNSDPLFKEFEWDALYKIGPVWDNATGGDAIYLDDVYIGGPNTSTASASEAPAAMAGITVTAEDGANQVSWASMDGVGGYNVYASLTPITDVTAEDVIFLRRVRFDENTGLEHRYEIPHPAAGAPTIYYAVTTLSGFGVENPSVAASTGSIANESLPQKPYIPQLTDDQADAIFNSIAADTPTDAAFAADHPVFVLDSSHRSPGDGTTVDTMPEDSDLSGRFKIGYTNFEELAIYGEITDNQVTFGDAASVTGATTYLYDSAEISFGNYDVRDVPGGGLLFGAPELDNNGTLSRGQYPEYGLRITGLVGEDGNVERSSTWIGFSLDVNLPVTTVEKTETGWRFLSLIPLSELQADGDEYMPVPASDEIQYIPLILSLNDADAAQRENQIVWSIKPNVTGQWWNRADQWEVVAVAGSDVIGTAAEDGSERDAFSLAQSSPNPVAGVADIAFTLGAPTRATVEVFNMLGQRVLTVTDEEFAAGSHEVSVDTRSFAAGVYVYRLSAGGYVATRRMTVVR